MILSSIHSKLLVLAGVPLLAITLILGTIIINKYNTVQEMGSLEPLSQLGVHIGALIHETQIERGISVKNFDNKTQESSLSILEQRSKTNSEIAKIKQYIDAFNALAYGTEFSNALYVAQQTTDNINDFRKEIDKPSVSMNEIIEFYSRHNSQWLNILHLSANLTDNTEISLLRSSYVTFLKAKESAGLERALISHVFSTDQLSAEEHSKFKNLLSEQNIYFEQFAALASSKELSKFLRLISSPSAQEVQRIREIVLSKGELSRKPELLLSLYEGLGYGGSVHQFKNFLLRSEPKYKKLFDKALTQVFSALDEFENLKVTTEQENIYIATIRSTANEYQSYIEHIATMKKEGMGIAEIDGVVRIDDEPALNAIHQLAQSVVIGNFNIDPEHWFDVASKKIELLYSLEKEIAEDLRLRGSILRGDAQKILSLLTLLMIIIIYFVLITAKFLIDAINTSFIELKQSKNVIESLADGIITIDETGIILSFTQAATEIFGYSRNEVIGRNVSMLMPEAFSNNHDQYLKRYKKTGKKTIIGQTRDVVGLRKDGSEFPMELSVGEVEFDGKSIYIGSVRDVSKQKIIENELLLAKENAEKLAKAKSEFLARMSHEIRTPMNGIIGTASLIEGTNLNEKQKHYIHTIKTSGDSLLTILNEILDFTSLEAGKVKVVSEPFDLYHCTDEIYHLFQAPLQEKGLEFKLEYKDIPEYIVGDEGRIRQVILNFLNNAMKFTDEGHVGLRIEAIGLKKSDTQHLKVSVTDTGAGVPEDKIDELFKTFSQVDESSVRKTGGTGLGLSICKALIEMMDGELGVDSVENEGSAFWFKIPLIIPSEKELVEYSCKNIKKEILLDYTSYYASVLLVEDVDVNIFVITEILESFGCSVDHAANGKIAVDMNNKKNYDIIFMDCQMPVMDGFQATTEIRNVNKEIPIISLTANVLMEEIDKCFKVGMSAFLSKPVTKEDFAAMLNVWIPDMVNGDDIKQDDETSSKGADGPVDFQVLEQFGDNANKIIELTIKDADDFIAKMNNAIDKKNIEDLGLEAHSFKSVMAQIGAIKLSELAKELEMKGKSDDLDDIADLFAALKSEYMAAKQALLKHVKNNV